MPYAIKENGYLRSVTEDMALNEGEALFADIPQWVYDLQEKEQQYRASLDRESEWRSDELSKIARQLEAIEEDEAGVTPPDLLPGTRKQWLRYRGLVSNWKVGATDFPDPAGRPMLAQ